MARKKRTHNAQPRATRPNLPVPLMAVLGCFIVSRLLAYAASIRFDSYRGIQLMHFIPEELLRTRLLSSVFHLHNQPPLFNIYLGIVYKLFPGSETTVFHAVHFLMGAALAVTMYLLMTRLGVSGRVSAVLTCLFTVSPAAVLFENLLYYTFPVAVMLCLSAFFLHRFMDGGRILDGAVFFSLLAAIVLTRSMFHLAWFAAWLCIVVMLRRSRWKKTVLVAVIPFAAALFPFAKNAVLFGGFSSSSWLGMSLAKITTMKLSEDERIDRIGDGELSELSLLPPFKPVWYYKQYTRIPAFQETGVPVLDMDMYPNGGHNWNNASLYSISEQYLEDALFVLKRYPGVFLGGVADSFRIFFFPAGDWFHFYASIDNISHISLYEKLYNFLVCGQVTAFGSAAEKRNDQWGYFDTARHMGFLILAFYLAAVGYGVFFLVRSVKRGTLNTPAGATMLFIVLTVLYVTLIGNCLESGENERFRFTVDPLLMIAFGVFIQRIVPGRKNDGR